MDQPYLLEEKPKGLVITTLGTGDDEQIIDALHGSGRSNFMFTIIFLHILLVNVEEMQDLVEEKLDMEN